MLNVKLFAESAQRICKAKRQWHSCTFDGRIVVANHAGGLLQSSGLSNSKHCDCWLCENMLESSL